MPYSDQNADIDLSINPGSAHAVLRDLEKAYADMAKGVVGSAAKVEAALQKAEKVLVSVGDRAALSQERYLKSLERTAVAAGKTGEERLIAQRNIIIKQLGGEAEVVRRVTAAYKQLIDVENKRKPPGGGEHGFYSSPAGLALRGVKDLFEGRTAYGEVMLGRSLIGLQGTAVIIGGIATGLTAMAAASYKAAASLAEYGTQIKDVQLRTGLTAREVGQFTFAAQASGQEIGVFERAMRGLSQASDDTSKSGDVARKKLQELGVTLQDSVTGKALPTGQVLETLSIALNKLPPGVERDAAAMAIFKRAGIEMLPALSELSENLKTAREHGWGPGEAEIARLRAYQKTLTELDTTWNEFTRAVKEFVAPPIILTIKMAGAGWQLLKLPGEVLFSSPATAADREMRETGGFGYGASMSRGAHAGELAAITRNDLLVKAAKRGGGEDELTSQLRQAKDDLQSLQAQLKLGMSQSSINAPILAKIGTQRGRVAGLEEEIKRDQERKSLTKSLADEVFSSTAKELDAYSRINAKHDETIEKMRTMGYTAKQLAINIDAADKIRLNTLTNLNAKLDEQYVKDKRALEISTSHKLLELRQHARPVTSIRELGRGGLGAPTLSDIESDINRRFAERVRDAQETRARNVTDIQSEVVAAGDMKGIHERDLALLKEQGRFTEEFFSIRNTRDKEMTDLHQRDNDQQRAFVEEMSKIKFEDQRNEIRHDTDMRARREAILAQKDGTGGEIQAAVREYDIRISGAEAELRLSQQRIRDNETGRQAERSQAEALKAADAERNKAREDAELHILEIQHKQMESIKQVSASLFETLFTSPSKFGSQLSSTIRSAFLHPITEGLGGMAARALHPLIFGPEGTTGLAGSLRNVFGGGTNTPIGSTPARPMYVYEVNPTVAATSTGFEQLAGGPSFAGIRRGTVSQPIGGSAMLAMLSGLSFAGGGGGAVGGGVGELIGVGGGGGFAHDQYGFAIRGTESVAGGGGDVSLGAPTGGGGIVSGWPSGSAGRPTGPSGISGLVRGFSPKNLTSALGNFKEFAGIGQQIGGGTSAKSVASSPAALLGGTILAQQSLMPGGKWAGTPMGIIGGAAGGALIGAQFGPLGAAIGAGVGFGIGLGELLAGVEPQWKEAERLVKQQYGITINKDQANRIVGIAQQSYGGRVSIAVRSPEVRQMMGIYAAGTGQSLAPSASQPHGASLVESGGSLYQNPVMQYGKAYSYASNLPVYGGGGSTGQLSNPGGSSPTYISMNISGDAVAPFMTGNYVTPEFVNSQNANAWRASQGRVSNAMILSEPGSIVS